MSYRTKKKNAIISIGVKARKLFMADAISVNDVTKLEEIMKRAHRKL